MSKESIEAALNTLMTEKREISISFPTWGEGPSRVSGFQLTDDILVVHLDAFCNGTKIESYQIPIDQVSVTLYDDFDGGSLMFLSEPIKLK